MNRLLCVLLIIGCGTSELTSREVEGAGSTQDELNVSSCIQLNANNPIDFLDGGLDDLLACLADAGFAAPPLPPFDGGLPPIPSFDAGLPPFPSFDGGIPPLPAFDAGIPPFPAFDAGIPAGLLDPCSAGCTCPNGLTCLNPLSQTCPGTLTLCIP